MSHQRLVVGHCAIQVWVVNIQSRPWTSWGGLPQSNVQRQYESQTLFFAMMEFVICPTFALRHTTLWSACCGCQWYRWLLVQYDRLVWYLGYSSLWSDLQYGAIVDQGLTGDSAMVPHEAWHPISHVHQFAPKVPQSLSTKPQSCQLSWSTKVH